MDDELDQEGMEDEVSAPSKSSGGGSPLKMIIIIGVIVVIAAVGVFGFILPMFFGEPEEGQERAEEIDLRLTEYGKEHPMEPMTFSMLDEGGRRVRSMVVTCWFELGDGADVNQLLLREGLIIKIIENNIKSFEFRQLLLPMTVDSIQNMVTRELNTRMPKPNFIASTKLRIVTQ